MAFAAPSTSFGNAPDDACADLSANENPLGPAPHVLALLAQGACRCHRYPDRHAGSLRETLALRLRVAASQVVVGNGSCEVLELAARAALSPGQSAVIASPSFPPYRSVVRKAHGVVRAVPLGTGFAYDFERLTAAVAPDTRLVILGNPNNPTGTTASRDALTRFLDALPDRVLVVLDEAYREYVAQEDFPDALDYVAQGRRVLAVRSFSKAYALAGLRIGYGVGAPALAAELDSLRSHYNTSIVAQSAALAALEDAEHLSRSVRLNAQGRALLSDALAGMGIEVVPSQANFLLVRVGGGDAMADELEARGVRVKSGSGYGLTDYIRVSIGLPGQNERLLAALASALRSGATQH